MKITEYQKINMSMTMVMAHLQHSGGRGIRLYEPDLQRFRFALTGARDYLMIRREGDCDGDGRRAGGSGGAA